MKHRNTTVRITSLKDQGYESDLENTTPAERIDMMWQLACDAWAFTGNFDAESRLPRHVVRVIRGAWPHRLPVSLEGVPVPVIGRTHLIQNKRAAGRPKDLIDLDWLQDAPQSSQIDTEFGSA